MPRKYILKLTEEELMEVYKILFKATPSANIKEVIHRIRLIASGDLPEFIEED